MRGVAKMAAWLLIGLVGAAHADRKVVADFRLHDYRGAEKSLSELMGPKGLAIVFVGTECPLVKLYSVRLNQLADELAAQGVPLVAINANSQDSLAEIGQFAKDYLIRFTILKDPDQKVADDFGAKRTPEVFLLDPTRAVRYSGRIDDQYGVGFQRPEPSRKDLAVAVEELVAGKEVSVARTNPPGCFIGRPREVEATGDVTYSSHVAAIFQQRCLECHRDGEIGPFALTSYDNAVAWSETIVEVIDQGRMPPWFADPKFGTFMHDPRLSDEEKESIRTWVANGCPRGVESQLTESTSYVDGWQMEGEPDVVFYMSDKPYKVPAEGTLDYVYYEIDPKWDEDRWVLGSEARAGNRSVVHHILVFVKRPGKFYPPGLPGELISAYAPGMKPTVGADDSMALLVPKGSKFIMQMHYTANGRPQEDLSYFGVKLAKDPSKIKWEIRPGMAINLFFQIPPMADNYRVPGLYVFNEDSLLLGVNPHMHMRGKSFTYEAVYPDGRKETLMSCPKYDFNWQLGYQYVEPLVMPKGTKLVCNGYFDNSDKNPSNPDPHRAVRFGEQTWDEMMIGWFYYAVKRPDAVASN